MAKKTVAGTQQDPTIQFETLTIDDVSYRLAYSFNAIAEAESRAGCNLLLGLESLTNLSALQLRGLLYAALTVAQPDITVEHAGALVRLDTIASITTALGAAYIASMPKKKTQEPASEVATAQEAS